MIVIEAPECASYVRVSEVKRAVVSSDLGHGVSGELRNALLPCHFFIGLDQAFCDTSNGNLPCVRLDRMYKIDVAREIETTVDWHLDPCLEINDGHASTLFDLLSDRGYPERTADPIHLAMGASRHIHVSLYSQVGECVLPLERWPSRVRGSSVGVSNQNQAGSTAGQTPGPPRQAAVQSQ